MAIEARLIRETTNCPLTDSQALTISALVDSLSEEWFAMPSFEVAPYGNGTGDYECAVVAVFTLDSPAPNPIIRVWLDGDSYECANPNDWDWYSKRLGIRQASFEGRAAVQREDDVAYVILSGGSYSRA
jgi:hypothetical protein